MDSVNRIWTRVGMWMNVHFVQPAEPQERFQQYPPDGNPESIRKNSLQSSLFVMKALRILVELKVHQSMEQGSLEHPR